MDMVNYLLCSSPYIRSVYMANASFRNKMYINLCYVLSEEQHFMNIHSDWCFKFITRICSGIDFALILFSFYLTFPPVCVCVCVCLATIGIEMLMLRCALFLRLCLSPSSVVSAVDSTPNLNHLAKRFFRTDFRLSVFSTFVIFF